MTAKNTALRLLSIKSRSVQELRKKLTLRGFSEPEIEAALEACRSYGYLDDEEEAKRRNERLKRKGYGPHLIAAKLRSQGLKGEQMSFSDQMEVIRTLLTKPAWKKKEKRKLIAALQRRGFDLECILASEF